MYIKQKYQRFLASFTDSALFTQSSRLQSPGDVSRIISGIHDPGIEENCLQFHYMVEGGDTAILNVHLIQMDISKNITKSNNTLLWTARGSGMAGWNWVLATISIVTDVRFQVNKRQNFSMYKWFTYTC